MASYTIPKNGSLTVDLISDFSDSGWEISNNKAYHSGCNAGYMDWKMNLTGHTSWTFEYIIGEVISGGVNIVVNGVNGIVRTQPGTYQETFTITGANIPIRFYSDGENSVEILKTFPVLEESNGKTLVFNEDVNKWGGYHSYNGEYMHKFTMNSFFVFKNGRLFEQDVNPIHNNFFSIQYTSKIKFVANENHQLNKLWFVIKIDSNGRWSVPEMVTIPNETFPNGMKSKLHENNFDLDHGTYWADIKRDMLDPQFTDQIQALFEGRTIEGDMLIVELETKETTPVKLSGVYLTTAEQHRNF